MKKTLSLILALVMIISALGLSSCTNEPAKTEPAKTSDATAEPAKTGDEPAQTGEVEKDTYTINYYMESPPLDFNPHTWQMSNESTVLDYISAGLVDVGYVKDADGNENWEWIYNMASNIEDITATYEDAAKWGIEAGETGRVWKISLKEQAAWEDGTPINADTYIYSMQQLLDPAMQNYRANSYYTGSDSAIWGAYSYYKGGPQNKYAAFDAQGITDWSGVEDIYVDAAGLWSLDASCLDENGNGCPGWLKITDETKYRDNGVADENDPEAWISGKYLYETYLAPGMPYESYAPSYLGSITGQTDGDGTWDTVGIVKVDDYTFLYITESPISQFYFNSAMTSGWLVYKDLYEANKETKENGTVVTKYGKDADTIKSYGPYKMTSFTNTGFTFEKNTEFPDFKDGQHEGQWQADVINYRISSEHATNLLGFLAGTFDEILLTPDDIAKYKYSDNLLKTDTTYTFRYFFCTDYEALCKLEEAAGDGSNKRALAYKDFRNALSLAINRDQLATESTAGSKATFNLFNGLYYYDIENDPESQYKYSDESMAGILELYGMDSTGLTGKDLRTVYETITGYSVEDAKAKFQAAYEAMKAKGDYTDGQAINITCYCSADDTVQAPELTQCELLNQYIAAATEGTGFEGKVTITFKTTKDPSRYDLVRTGQAEMARGAWGGAAFYPFSTIRCYADPDYTKIHEASGLYYEGSAEDWGGYNPSKDTLAITVDGKELTKTVQEWAKSINSGEYATADGKTKLRIMAAIEQYILSNFYCIPVYSETEVTLYTYKYSYATTNYNIMYGYGGLRNIKFNYSDAQWKAYVESQGGKLSYE